LRKLKRSEGSIASRDGHKIQQDREKMVMLLKRVTPPILGLLIFGPLLAAACAVRIGDFEIQVGDPELLEVGELRHEERQVPLGDLESVQVEVNMGAGELNLNGGAEELMEASFDYNVEQWQPEVDLERVEGRGTLIVRQPFKGTLRASGVRNEWSISLNDEILTSLVVRLGAGEGKLNLSGMNLDDLAVEVGAGKVTIDVSGDWQRDIDIKLTRGVGEAIVYFPAEVGVRIESTNVLGEVTLVGFNKRGDAYVNDAFGESDTNISFEILGAIGKVYLEVIE
jgi:hypothetical protein